MADENNPSGQEDNGGNKPNPDEGKQQPSPSPDGSRSQQLSPEEQARRDAQSAKDKNAGNQDDDSDQRLSFLEAREMERVRKEHVSTFLTDNAKDYPNVKPDDPMFKYAGSEDEVKEIATELQNRFTTMQQDALSSVREGEDQSLTDEQIAEEEKKLAEDTAKTGKSNFGSFMGNLQRRKK